MKHAVLEFDSDGVPRSRDYGDIYFSEDGFNESQHVYLDGNQLQECWHNKRTFHIGETGFGTGLNFLLTWKTWRKDVHASDTLVYFSAEKHPVSVLDLARIHQLWPQLSVESELLLRQYPPCLQGFHVLEFDQGRVRLVLAWGDVLHALDECLLRFDTWYLDGFAPELNPEMWQKSLLKRIAAHSKPGARFSTFTAKGVIRRALLAQNFEVQKRIGYGRKREHLVGCYAGPDIGLNLPPWYSPMGPYKRYQSVAIVGAGIAGAQLAYELSNKGLKVTIYDAGSLPATAASGNEAAVFAPKLTAVPSLGERFYLTAWSHQLRAFEGYAFRKRPLDNPLIGVGVTRIGWSQRESSRVSAVLARADLSELCAHAPRRQRSAYLLKGTGWLNPKKWVRQLLEHSNCQLKLAASVENIVPNGAHWRVDCGLSPAECYDAVVLATGAYQQLLPDYVPIRAVRGQTTVVALKQNSETAQTVLDYQGYLIPLSADKALIGATYYPSDSTAVRVEDDEGNRGKLAQFDESLSQEITAVVGSHAAQRATTLDRWPIVGECVDAARFCADYEQILKHGKKYAYNVQQETCQGLYVFTGLGSHGMTTSGLLARTLAELMTANALTLERSFFQSIHPSRFMVRQLKRRQK